MADKPLTRKDVINLLAGLGLLDGNGRPNLSPNGSGKTASSATAGANGDVPAQVASYLDATVNGIAVRIPLYFP